MNNTLCKIEIKMKVADHFYFILKILFKLLIKYENNNATIFTEI